MNELSGEALTQHDDGTDHLLAELETLATALGRMFPGLCEVVLHDLRDPQQTIRVIENNLSGRSVGMPATELGLARLQDPSFPSVIQNYANTFPDGRPAKSTSIGVRDAQGNYVAALCLNLDTSTLALIAGQLAALTATTSESPIPETITARNAADLRDYVQQYAAQQGKVPAALDARTKRGLVQELHRKGFTGIRNAVPTIAASLSLSRGTVYNYLK